jgi:hypothetical protein
MANYANQKRIVLGHLRDIAAAPYEHEAFLPPLRWAPIKVPLHDLNGNAFKLWVYLLSWEGQGYYDFSPANLAKELSMSDQGARNARQELIDKGYLRPSNTNPNILEFFPISQ